MNSVSQAVVLMAGSGSRLRGSDEMFLKPLAPMLGRPLICYTMEALGRAGIRKINFIVGFARDRLVTAVKDLAPPGVEIQFIDNPDWPKQNGISLLVARDQVAGPFLLAMCDHLFDDAIVDLLLETAEVDSLNLAVDRKIDSVFDLDDAMKVQTKNDRVVAIGKNLREYNAIDTGLFVCPNKIFDYLERAKKNDDCSLADGVRLMAADNKVRTIDIGEAWWQDVDTPEMFEQAEKHLAARSTLSAP
jgi:1L-myo-inositol 1-phosphate cytidylyltransferase